jgi:hypothetical protein
MKTQGYCTGLAHLETEFVGFGYEWYSKLKSPICYTYISIQTRRIYKYIRTQYCRGVGGWGGGVGLACYMPLCSPPPPPTLAPIYPLIMKRADRKFQIGQMSCPPGPHYSAEEISDTPTLGHENKIYLYTPLPPPLQE